MTFSILPLEDRILTNAHQILLQWKQIGVLFSRTYSIKQKQMLLFQTHGKYQQDHS